MDWKDWQPIYQDIVQRLGIDPVTDYRATDLVTELLENSDPEPLLRTLRYLIEGRIVVVCGAGPSIGHHVRYLYESSYRETAVFVAADGAATALLEAGLRCDVIVTDLDGDITVIKTLQEQGALVIIHAHGDNIDLVRAIVPTLQPVLASTQVEPTERAFLWGGFTDGDRACHIVSHYNPKSVVLAGMDFGNIVGRWSKPGRDDNFPADERKQIKLSIAEELVYASLDRSDIEYTRLE